MEIQLNLEKLRKYKLFVTAPLYGGNAAGFFTKSMMDLVTLCTKLQIDVQPFFIFNESLITRARNYIADEFLRSDCTHMIFIDGDIDFRAEDVLVTLHYCIERDLDIVCGPYPKKNISWEKVKAAVDAGKADNNPNDLEKYIGDFVLSVPKAGEYNLGEPIEVLEAGTGFMLFPRKTLTDFAAAYPELSYIPDHKRTKHFNGNREITAFFLDVLDNKRHLSEDYMFCHWSRRIGKKIWLLPWIKLNHVGMYTFQGDLISVIASGASPTIKESDVGKMSK